MPAGGHGLASPCKETTTRRQGNGCGRRVRRQLRRFLQAVADDRHHALWTFAATTGVRRSELLGLRWVNLDERNRTATISQTITATASGYQPSLEQKSLRAGRTIHVDARTFGTLLRRRDVQRDERAAAGLAWQRHDLVFAQSDASWWNPPAISLAFKRATLAVGVPPIRLHGLRHTHATLLLRAGVNTKVVSERLGHSSVAFTLDTYSHVMPGMQPEAAELFPRLVYDGIPTTQETPHDRRS